MDELTTPPGLPADRPGAGLAADVTAGPQATAAEGAAPPDPPDAARLTHVDERGAARMVDVSAKPETERVAVASARVVLAPATAALLASGGLPKGDALAVARVAGIMGAKRTADLIPLCHPLPLSFIDVEVAVESGAGEVALTAEAQTSGQTGVEMEAMTACAVAALTVYDMVKAMERGVVIEGVRLLEKTGGKHDWRQGG